MNNLVTKTQHLELRAKHLEKKNIDLLNIAEKLLRIVKTEAKFYIAHIEMAEKIIADNK